MKGKPCQHGDPLDGFPRAWRKFGRELLKQGFRLVRTKRNHVLVLAPNGVHVGTFGGHGRDDAKIVERCRRQIARNLSRAVAA